MSLSESRPAPVPVYVRHGHTGQDFRAQDGGHVDQEHERLYEEQYQGQGYPEKELHEVSEHRGFPANDVSQYEVVGGGDPADGEYYGYGIRNPENKGYNDYGNDRHPKYEDLDRAHGYGLQGTQALLDGPAEREYQQHHDGGNAYYGGVSGSFDQPAGNKYETNDYSNEYVTDYDEYDYQIEEDFEKELNRNGAGFHGENIHHSTGHQFKKEGVDHVTEAEYDGHAKAGVYLQGFGPDIFADHQGGPRTAELGFDDFHNDQYDFIY